MQRPTQPDAILSRAPIAPWLPFLPEQCVLLLSSPQPNARIPRARQLVDPGSPKAVYRTYFKPKCSAEEGDEYGAAKPTANAQRSDWLLRLAAEARGGAGSTQSTGSSLSVHSPTHCRGVLRSPPTKDHPVRVIWSYWHDEVPPAAIAANVFSWAAKNPGYVVRLLNQWTIRCYLEDSFGDIPPAAPVKSYLIRLQLLYVYGGVWLDPQVVLIDPLDAIIPWDSLVTHGGIYAVSHSSYSTPNTTDFVHAWALAASPGSIVMELWSEALTRLIRANGGRSQGLSRSSVYSAGVGLDAYRQINQLRPVIPNGPSYWRESLPICVVFTYLYQYVPIFRRSVRDSKLDRGEEVGYFLQTRLINGTRRAVNEALLAKRGKHRLHSQLLSSKMIALSRRHLYAIEAARGLISELLAKRARAIAPRRHEFQLVISRFKENIDWSTRYTGLRTVYNKGAPVSAVTRRRLFADYGEVYADLPNVGREAHTYLTYIIDHYDSLPGYVGFSQGGLDPAFDWIRRDYGEGMYDNMLLEARRNGCSNSHVVRPDSPGEWSWR